MCWRKKTRWFLAGSEVDFDDSDQLKRILQSHCIDENSFKIFTLLQSGLELRETRGNLFDVYEHADSQVERVLTDVELPDIPFSPHRLFFLTKDENGGHQFGGEPPVGFQLPSCTGMKTSFQYLGFIDGTDQQFTWLDTPQLHLIYPLYECNFGVYFDCGDPQNPRVLNPETFDSAWWNETQSGSETVRFMPTRYSTIFSHPADQAPICGVPMWLQAPEIPSCPVTGETMRFVCQIASDEGIGVIPGREGKNLPFADKYLCFGDCGYLYVFYHPGSKVMHLQAQW